MKYVGTRTHREAVSRREDYPRIWYAVGGITIPNNLTVVNIVPSYEYPPVHTFGTFDGVNGTFTFTEAGVAVVHANVLWAENGTGHRLLQVTSTFSGTTDTWNLDTRTGTTSVATICSGIVAFPVISGVVLRLRVRQASGGALAGELRNWSITLHG